MSHNITDRDGVFSVREAMWHGLGTVLGDYPTRDEAQKIAHPWEPVPEPLFRRVVTIQGDQPVETFEEIEGRVAIVRDDTNEVIGTASDGVGESIVKNSTMYDIAEALQGGSPDTVKFETGGSLLLRAGRPHIVRRALWFRRDQGARHARRVRPRRHGVQPVRRPRRDVQARPRHRLRRRHLTNHQPGKAPRREGPCRRERRDRRASRKEGHHVPQHHRP